MHKPFLAFFAALSFTAAFAGVDVNQASEAELDGIKGVGPTISRLIIAERKKLEFKSWPDFIGRIKGMGNKSAARFSAQGMTVGGVAYEADIADTVDAKPAQK